MPDEIYEKRKLSTEKKLSSILRFGIFILLLIVSTHVISESIRPPELRDEFNGTCVEKHSFIHNGTEYFSVTLQNEEFRLPWLVTEGQYKTAEVGKNYSYKSYWKNGETVSYHLVEVARDDKK
jgi:hypothetical protein